MLYYQTTTNQNNGLFPTWNNIFQNYNANQSFQTAVQHPQMIFSGINNSINLQPGICLSTGQDTMIAPQQNTRATILGMITCTALLARCGTNSNVYVAHVASGHIDANILQILQQLQNTYPNQTPQAIYIIPSKRFLNTYMNDVNAIIHLGYETCLIAPYSQSAITNVIVDGGGSFYMY